MRIAHMSMPADHPETAAKVLAHILEGEAIRFPPGGPDAWMAWSSDGEIEIELTRRGLDMIYGPAQGDWVPTRQPHRGAECHAAITVDRPAAEILAIAQAAGWPARICDRGGIFHVAEVWVDGVFLIEFLDPDFAREYARAVTPAGWKAYLAQMDGQNA